VRCQRGASDGGGDVDVAVMSEQESHAVWLILECLRDLSRYPLLQGELQRLARTYTWIALDFGMSVVEIAEATEVDYYRVYGWAQFAPVA
jgi:hypothetical protein